VKRWIVKAGATSIEQLVLEDDAAIPVPRPDEVLIKVHAVSLNRRDQILLSGQFGAAAEDFVAVSDGAGEIAVLGQDVTGWAVGDKVISVYYPSWPDGPPAPNQGWGLGSPGQNGMLSEYVVLPVNRIAPAPKTLSLAESATLPCAALTAWTALNGDRPYSDPIAAGDSVISLGTGSVSLFATLIAKAAGARVAITTSDDSKLEKIRALGVANVVNYRAAPEWGKAAREQFGAFDRVVNAAGSSALDQSIVALAPGGEIALMGLFEFADKAPDFIGLMTKGGSIRGTSVGSAAALHDLVLFIDAHGIKPPIGRTFGFTEAREAYRTLDAFDVFGKVVITVTN
jgi:NADPH:quinone reductase-like Zn-dependent oxidoreductase